MAEEVEEMRNPCCVYGCSNLATKHPAKKKNCTILGTQGAGRKYERIGFEVERDGLVAACRHGDELFRALRV